MESLGRVGERLAFSKKGNNESFVLPGRKEIDIDAGGFLVLAVRRQESPQSTAGFLLYWRWGCQMGARMPESSELSTVTACAWECLECLFYTNFNSKVSVPIHLCNPLKKKRGCWSSERSEYLTETHGWWRDQLGLVHDWLHPRNFVLNPCINHY